MVPDERCLSRVRQRGPRRTKRYVQLGMLEQVLQNTENANEQVKLKGKILRFCCGQPFAEAEQETAAWK